MERERVKEQGLHQILMEIKRQEQSQKEKARVLIPMSKRKMTMMMRMKTTRAERTWLMMKMERKILRMMKNSS